MLTGVHIRFAHLIKGLLSARMADGLMILHFEMCLFKEGNCMAIFFCQAQLVAGLAGL